MGGWGGVLLTSPGARREAQLRAPAWRGGDSASLGERWGEPGVLISLRSRVGVGFLFIGEFKTGEREFKAREEGEKKNPSSSKGQSLKSTKTAKAKGVWAEAEAEAACSVSRLAAGPLFI